MNEEASRWREKYLQSLEQQEQQEALWNTRLDLLRRSLVRSSFAVEGADPVVEKCMRDLRDVLRDEDLDHGLAELVPRLERAVLDTERNKQERIERLALGLQRLTTQLLALPLPSEVRKPLKIYARKIRKGALQPRDLPALLGELAGLQDRALTLQLADQPRNLSLFSRLFGQRDMAAASVVAEQGAAVAPEAVAADAQLEPEATEAVEFAAPQPVAQLVGEAPSDAPEALDRYEPIALPMVADPDELPEPTEEVSSEADGLVGTGEAQGYVLPATPEQAYSAIAERVEAMLFGLLDDLQQCEAQREQAQALRERIQRGLNWYELVPLLDDLAQLMIAVANQSQREFENYLQLLNERLAGMQESLGATHDGHARSREAAQALDEELRQQVGGLQSSVLQAEDLPSLKQGVQARLDALLATVDVYERQRSVHEKQLAERLNTLVERVANLEQAATGLRLHLAEQRKKALHDPLTDLPNRAAWDERLEMEVARQQRYGGQLLLAVLDVDHFKRINDSFGHLAGDRVLKIIANELRKRLRKTDFIARFGGEEFALLLPETPLEAGQQLLESLRQGIQNCPFHFKGERIDVTLSGGLAAFAEAERAEHVFERADRALYRAKGAGRNRIEIA
ncbi:GGDEF domain-containing protein [Pseudomonas saudiphocaensis]|uniref:diguanylate cyclase n=1 Tax=Pseudomonas saudiphocaensis TaxID=1499686 RepID=A0A078LUE7_9PSED|nr:GGDEF domain-containing protein [Pseudomonas saudiphocaensis]CDZ94824.1 diguanylate cyclase [Pseudomonas saudiphocaensis]